jgi:hypothetical protein
MSKSNDGRRCRRCSCRLSITVIVIFFVDSFFLITLALPVLLSHSIYLSFNNERILFILLKNLMSFPGPHLPFPSLPFLFLYLAASS